MAYSSPAKPESNLQVLVNGPGRDSAGVTPRPGDHASLILIIRVTVAGEVCGTDLNLPGRGVTVKT
jgi:hypothetical protein